PDHRSVPTRRSSDLPIVVGGTGLYLRTLLEGLFPGPQRSEELRDRLRQGAQSKGSAYLHRLLHRLDPAAAGRIHGNDTPKLIRADRKSTRLNSSHVA